MKTKPINLLARVPKTARDCEEQNLTRWLVERKNLINIKEIEQRAGTPRAIAQVLANMPNRRLQKHLEKIIPVVTELGYKQINKL